MNLLWIQPRHWISTLVHPAHNYQHWLETLYGFRLRIFQYYIEMPRLKLIGRDKIWNETSLAVGYFHHWVAMSKYQSLLPENDSFLSQMFSALGEKTYRIVLIQNFLEKQKWDPNLLNQHQRYQAHAWIMSFTLSHFCKSPLYKKVMYKFLLHACTVKRISMSALIFISKSVVSIFSCYFFNYSVFCICIYSGSSFQEWAGYKAVCSDQIIWLGLQRRGTSLGESGSSTLICECLVGWNTEI